MQEEAYQAAISGSQGEGYLYSRCSIGQEGSRALQLFKLLRQASCLLHLQCALGPSQGWRRPWIGFGQSSGLGGWLPRIYFWTLRPDRAGLHWQWGSITPIRYELYTVIDRRAASCTSDLRWAGSGPAAVPHWFQAGLHCWINRPYPIYLRRSCTHRKGKLWNLLSRRVNAQTSLSACQVDI